MSDTTWIRIEIEAPELATLTADQKALILEDVILDVPGSVWGAAEERAQRYLAAHYGTLMNYSAKNSAGPVNSKSVGSVSIGFGQTSYSDPTRYDETVYGRKYMNLRKATIGCNLRAFTP